MKILQLIHKSQNRGAETFACQLSYHLVKLGHDVKIVTVYSGEARLPFSPDIETLGASMKKDFLDIRSLRKLSEIIKKFNPDIIQANSGDTLKYSIISKKLFRWKTPIIVRNASEVGRYLKSNTQKIFNKFLYKNVDRVISVSKASKTDLLNHFPFLNGKIDVIPVGLELDNSIHEVIYKPLTSKHIVHVGGFSFEKNHQGLLRIFKKVLKNQPNTILHLIGDGPLLTEIKNNAAKEEILEHIIFHGFVDNPLDYITSADLLVLPSKIEGLPGVLLEAMYCKTPVIAYAVGGIPEIVNRHTGYLVGYGEEKIFADTICIALTEDNDEMTNYAFNYVKENFNNKILSEKFIASYKTLKN